MNPHPTTCLHLKHPQGNSRFRVKPTLTQLANRIKIDRQFLKEYPEKKELLEKRLKQNAALIVDTVVANYAD